ncbi:MAG: methyltransferase [Rhodovibrionaceae bacterium]|nr:methyltransferase [Rhodovibrionaceae bacterium]
MSDASSASMRAPEATDDRLLDGRVLLRQPASGYRVAIDPVLLAAAVPAHAGETVLDLGCGAGAAALCLLTRVAGVRVTGLELQPELAALARQNAAANGREDTFRVVEGDLLNPPSEVGLTGFDHVMANPPFLPADAGSPPPDAGRAGAQVEGRAALRDWVETGLGFLRARGRLTMIHRADRLESLLGALDARAGDIAVLPLWPAEGRPARRVIVSARKAVAGPTRLLPGLVLHAPEGGITSDADGILRYGRALPLEARGGDMAT